MDAGSEGAEAGGEEPLLRDLRAIAVAAAGIFGAVGVLVGGARDAHRAPRPPLDLGESLSTAAIPRAPVTTKSAVAAPTPSERAAAESFGRPASWGWAGNGRGSDAGAPVLRALATVVSPKDGLPVDVVHRITRQSFGRFRLCYEQGLRKTPSLAGRVATRILIGRDGAVLGATDVVTTTTLSDRDVVQCITRAFTNLAFPSPAGGLTTAVVTIDLTPPR